MKYVVFDSYMDGYNYSNVLFIGLSKNHPDHYSISRIFGIGLYDFTDTLMQRIRGEGEISIILNLNVLDCAFAPSVIKPCSGGFSVRELFYILKRLSFLKEIKNVEIVGLNNELDVITLSALNKIKSLL